MTASICRSPSRPPSSARSCALPPARPLPEGGRDHAFPRQDERGPGRDQRAHHRRGQVRDRGELLHRRHRPLQRGRVQHLLQPARLRHVRQVRGRGPHASVCAASAWRCRRSRSSSTTSSPHGDRQHREPLLQASSTAATSRASFASNKISPVGDAWFFFTTITFSDSEGVKAKGSVMLAFSPSFTPVAH